MIKIYSTTWCPSCISAKKLLDSLNESYEEINIEEENITREKLKEITGAMTIPQIIINNQCIGGFDQLMELNQNGALKEMLKK